MFIFETNNTAIKFLIDTTLFNNCSNTENGGCISYSQEGEFIQDRICSYDSRVEDQDDIGVYCFIDVTNTSEFKNFIHDSSLTKSFYDCYASGFGNIFLQNGKIQIKSINVSYEHIMRDDFYTIYFLMSYRKHNIRPYKWHRNISTFQLQYFRSILWKCLWCIICNCSY